MDAIHNTEEFWSTFMLGMLVGFLITITGIYLLHLFDKYVWTPFQQQRKDLYYGKRKRPHSAP